MLCHLLSEKIKLKWYFYCYCYSYMYCYCYCHCHYHTWWRHQMETYSALLAFVRGIHRSPVNFPHKVQWRGALVFSLICAWSNGWVNNRGAGDLRRHSAHFDVFVMNHNYLYKCNTTLNILLISTLNIKLNNRHACSKLSVSKKIRRRAEKSAASVKMSAYSTLNGMVVAWKSFSFHIILRPPSVRSPINQS